MNRREFVGTAMGAVAAAATTAYAAPKDKFRWAMNGGIFRPIKGRYAVPGLTPHPDAGLKVIAKYGFQGVEEFLRGDMEPYFDRPAADFKRLLDEAGLSLCTIGGNVDPSKGKATIEENTKLAKFISDCGGKHLKVNLAGRGPGKVANTKTKDEYKAIADVLNEIGKRSMDVGVKFAHHPHTSAIIESWEEVRTMNEMTDPKYVGLICDTCHLSISGIDPLALMREAWPRVTAIHFKDADPKYNIAKTGWKGPAPTREQQGSDNPFKMFGTGGVNFLPIMDFIREKEYAGWITLDFDAPRPDEGSVMENMDKYKKYIVGTLKATLKAT